MKADTDPARSFVSRQQGPAAFQFADKRSSAAIQRQVQALANASAQAKYAASMQASANKTASPVQKKTNHTGLPDKLKSGIENLSGLSMDHVKVHYNSSKPAALQAHAYAQGSEIHVAPGQQRHLAHEAWHVVQQAQGRVKPTMQLKRGVPVNDDGHLEREADVMGAKALSVTGSAKPAQMKTPAGRSPVQRKRSHAAAFIEKHALGIKSDMDSVATFIRTADPSLHDNLNMRRGLLRAWNKGQPPVNRIATPPDLVSSGTSLTQVEDLSGWNSEDEDGLDLGKTMKKRQLDEVALERSGKTPDKTQVPHVSFFDAIRFGRQANKRDDYGRLPMISELGGHHLEFDNPGTKDIYASPLEELKHSGDSGASSSKKTTGKVKKIRRFKRTGTSRDFNWKMLAGNLDAMKYADRKDRQLRMLNFFLKKGQLTKIDPVTAEALGAIASDLMKGSRGGRFFLHQALHHIQKSKSGPTFGEMFSGKSPIYRPAAVGGRALVTKEHAQIQLDANRLLGVNNCLINAIALAAGRPLPNLGQLMRIREHLQNYGQMLLANQETITLIQQVLGIPNPIAVIYQDRASEDFGGAGGQLLIYHVNGNHFVHVMPDNFVMFGSKKKKGKTGL